MLPAPSSRQLRRDNLRSTSATSSPSKPQQTLLPSSSSSVSPCFRLKFKPQICSLNCGLNPSKTHQIVDRTLDSNTQKQIISTSTARVYQGFKLNRHNSRRGAVPIKGCDGILSLVLKSLESEDDIEKALNLYRGKLSPKEQTVVLHKQRSWEKVVGVFQWMKSQDDYLPNVIHYNVVLRALGQAEKWDELRLCWIDMAKKGLVPTNNTYAMLVDVYGKAGLVKEALLWIKHMIIRGIFPDEVTMNTVVRVLKDVGEYDRADRFYNDWCVGKIELEGLEIDTIADFESGSTSDPLSFKHFLLTELFKTGGRNPGFKVVASEDMESSVRKPRRTATYNTLIDLYGKAGRLKDAADVFAEMLKSGVALDKFTFNTMIHTCGSHGHLSEAESLLRKMEERGISPDTKTYNTFLSLYADAGNLEAANRWYMRIREEGLFPDVVTYRAVLHLLCERKLVIAVEDVIKEMEKFGVCIDNQSLPVVIKMYVNEGFIDRAKFLFEKCQSNEGLLSRTYAAIIDAYAEKGLWAEAEGVFLCKRDLGGQKKDIVEYNVMIKAYGKAGLYEKAFMLFKGMKNHGHRPDECTYNTLIQMFSEGDLVDQARDLLTEMQGVGFKPNCLTFSALIASYVRSSRLSDAVDVYQEMAKAGVKPNEFVFSSLINGFAEAGSFEEARHYFNIMEEFGISANQVVLTCLMKAYGKAGIVEGAKLVYEKMKDLEGGPDVVASNSMLGLYAAQGMISEAKLIFDNLREKGWADRITYATMMYAYKNMGMLDESIEVAEQMKHSGLMRDCVSYNTVMACYATNGRLIECGEMLHEMISQKILLDGGTFKVLFTILKKADIPVEAFRQLELSYQEEKPYAKQAVITSVFSILGLDSFAVEACETITRAEKGLDSFAFNVAIKAYGASGKIDEAMRILMRMQDEGVKPDVVTFIHLVDCYGKFGMAEGVKRIYGQMKNDEIEATESLYKAIIEAFRRLNRRNLADMVSQEMRLNFDSQPSPDCRTEVETDYETEEETDNYVTEEETDYETEEETDFEIER